MKILGIETSCDETAVCVVLASGNIEKPVFKLLGNGLYSQVKTHAEYGGVFPALAKREHAKNLVPLLKKALEEASKAGAGVRAEYTGKAEVAILAEHASNPAGFAAPLGADAPVRVSARTATSALPEDIKTLLSREPGLFEVLQEFLSTTKKPDIDFISVTSGPGLEPALWVGINFALALGKIWNIPVYPTNHMAGHILSVLYHPLPPPNLGGGEGGGAVEELKSFKFPALALLVSGGHTELVLVKNWMDYEIIGGTRDDAVGEAFDKVARLLGLPYPGGPEISKLAKIARERGIISEYKLPRPMISSDDFDFSFSGIKTSVLYTLKKIPEITENIKLQIAREFEDAVVEVLIFKTRKALVRYGAVTLVAGGGVISNTYLRSELKKMIRDFPDTALLIPDFDLSTDNAVMIAVASYFNYLSGAKPATEITAEGNLSL